MNPTIAINLTASQLDAIRNALHLHMEMLAEEYRDYESEPTIEEAYRQADDALDKIEAGIIDLVKQVCAA